MHPEFKRIKFHKNSNTIMNSGATTSSIRKKKDNIERISLPGIYTGYSIPGRAGFNMNSLYLEMRDGIKIATDIYLPKKLQDKKIPAILYLTRYVRSFEAKFPFNMIAKTIFGQITKKEIKFFTSHHYAVVIADVRGTGASFGTRSMEFSPEEVEDGKEIVDWIISQPWSNKKVGSSGISYLGTTAEMLLVNQHPAVKACIPRSSIFDLYNDIVFPGGVRHGRFIEVWRDTTFALDKNRLKYIGNIAGMVIKNPKRVKEDKKGIQYKIAKEQHKNNFDIFAGIYRIAYRNEKDTVVNRSINEFSIHHYKDKIERSGTPIYRISGWYDGALANSAIKGYLGTSNSVKLLIGPWDHGPQQNISPFVKRKRQTFDVHTEMLRFFDHHLKDVENGIMNEQPISYYAMGKEEWRHANEWPVKEINAHRYFLSSDKTLHQKEKNKKEGSVYYPVDDKFGTGGGSRWNSLTTKYRYTKRISYFDWNKRAERLAHFTSEPLSENMELTGHPVAEIYLSSNANDAQLFIYVEYIDKNGKAHYLTEGQFRGLHRKISDKQPPYPMFGPYHTFNKEDAQEWIPGKVEKLHFELIPTSHLIPKGSRIRVSFAGADIDHFDPMDTTTDNPTEFQLFCTHEFPSAIQLPLQKV